MSRRKRTVLIVTVVAAVVAGLLAVATEARIIRWRLPDQSAMREYLETNPFDSYPELSDRQIRNDGTNHHVCFMCSDYGVTMGYELVEITSEPDQREFCDRVAATLANWQGDSRLKSAGVRDDRGCFFDVPHVLGHESWTMNVVVAFLPQIDYPVNEPPLLLVGIDDYTVD